LYFLPVPSTPEEGASAPGYGGLPSTAQPAAPNEPPFASTPPFAPPVAPSAGVLLTTVPEPVSDPPYYLQLAGLPTSPQSAHSAVAQPGYGSITPSNVSPPPGAPPINATAPANMSPEGAGGNLYLLQLAGAPHTPDGSLSPPGYGGLPSPNTPLGESPVDARLVTPPMTPDMPGAAGATTPSYPSAPSHPVPQEAAPRRDAPPYVQEAGLPSSVPTAVADPPQGGTGYEFRPEVVAAEPPAAAATPGLFDPYAVRRDFPILKERVRGREIVWLDNAATTQKPQAVIDRISYYYEHENSNVHRAAHTLAARATDAYEGAREKVRRFLNAPSSKDIVFVRGATEGINLVAQSWGRRHVEKGDEVVITWLEHHANIVPWQMLCQEKGARLRVAPVDDTGQIILEEYEKLLGPRTRIVAFPQVSNALGTVTPAVQMVEMAHRHGARVLCDGAQAVSHMPVDVQLLDCDFYVLSGHKIFAPTGIGVVYGKSEVLERMPPWQGGGNMIADVTFDKTVYQPPPGRFEAGTGSIADAVGLGAALDYLTGLGLPAVSRYEHDLRVYGEERLRTIPGLHIIGTAPDKAGVISFVLDGVRTEDVGGMLDLEGIAVRSGHHCAQPILRRCGLEATVRASLAPYNTREDLDALVAAVRRIQVGRPRPVS
jgi:cysteine desulfurase/selenocysteine lyase